jgi:hypothetical protein
MGGGVGTGIGAGIGEGAVGIRSDGLATPTLLFWCFFARKRRSLFTRNFAFQNQATKSSASSGTASPSPMMQSLSIFLPVPTLRTGWAAPFRLVLPHGKDWLCLMPHFGVSGHPNASL